MTKIKKALALMMVLVMAMTTLALPVSAETVEEKTQSLAPRGPAYFCPICSEGATFLGSTNSSKSVNAPAGSCSYYSLSHQHTVTTYYNEVRCPNCGTYKYAVGTATYCPYIHA